jgi:hypothetical protein
MKRTLITVVYGLACSLAAGCSSESGETPSPLPERHNSPIGWYCAGSKVKDEKAPGGFGPCDNFPKKCANGSPGPAGRLSLIAYPGEIVDVGNRKWMMLRLVNRTKEVAAFSACDSRLYIVQEALDQNGQWQALEGFPDTLCGNSFHRVFLEPEEYWDLYAPPRERSFKNKLRFRLESGGEAGIAQGAGTIYTNEIE